MRSLPFAFVFVVAVGVALAQAPRSYSIDAAPAEYKQAIGRAMRAFDSLQSTLSARLLSEMKAGVPAQAVGFEEGDFRGFFWAEVPKGGGK
jgi:hypothetical protein